MFDDDLWVEASRDLEREKELLALSQAKSASAGSWAFIARAASRSEFNDRVALSMDNLIKAASNAGVPVESLVSIYAQQYNLLKEAEEGGEGGGKQCANCGHTSEEHTNGGPCPTCGCKNFMPAMNEPSPGVSAEAAKKDEDKDDKDDEDKDDDDDDNDDSDDDDTDSDDDDKDDDDDDKNPFAKNANQYIKQQGDSWVITQKGTGKVLSHHDSREKAEESFAAMMSNKHGSFIDHVAALKTALEEGADPLTWLDGNNGMAAAEVPIVHQTEPDFSHSYSEVPSAMSAVSVKTAASVLDHIQANDPDRDALRTTASTEDDRVRHQSWAVKAYGPQAWEDYVASRRPLVQKAN